MLIKYIKDKELRLLYSQTELKQKILKFLFIRLINYPFHKRYKKSIFVKKLLKKIYKSTKIYSRTKIYNRCVVTNRSRGTLQAYSVSRLKLLELCRFGIIPGCKKAVW